MSGPLTRRPSLLTPKTPKPGVRDRFAPRVVNLNGRRPRENERRPGTFNIVTGLLYFNRRTGVFKLFLDFRRLFLVDTFLDGLRRGLYEILGFL